MTDSDQTEPVVFDPAEVQAVHRRLLAAREQGVEPDAADVEMQRKIMQSPYWMFDRPWAPDDY